MPAPASERSGYLWRVVGEGAESVADLVLADLGYSVFWHITEPGVHGVDLLSPDECVLAVEVKSMLRAAVEAPSAGCCSKQRAFHCSKRGCEEHVRAH